MSKMTFMYEINHESCMPGAEDSSFLTFQSQCLVFFLSTRIFHAALILLQPPCCTLQYIANPVARREIVPNRNILER